MPELLIGDVMLFNGERTLVKRCSPTRLKTTEEISEQLITRIYGEILRWSKDMCCCFSCDSKGVDKTIVQAFFVTLSEELCAGPFCRRCLDGTIDAMASNTGQLPDIPVYRVQVKLEFVKAFMATSRRKGLQKPVTLNLSDDDSVRLF